MITPKAVSLSTKAHDIKQPTVSLTKATHVTGRFCKIEH